MGEMTVAAGYGPAGCPRAIVLTFDNLGEASALERGTWSGREPLGEDPSVTRALPRLLHALDAAALTATFFAEAVNCELNPQALAQIAGRGHELGVHGWRHEPWGDLGPEEEAALLARATAAFRGAGLPAVGFRPPGGSLTGRTEGLLRAAGYRWYSAAAQDPPRAEPPRPEALRTEPRPTEPPRTVPRPTEPPDRAAHRLPRPTEPPRTVPRPTEPPRTVPRVQDGVVSVPFSWDLVDAYHLMDRFADLRTARGDAAAPAPPAVVAERLTAALRDATAGVQTVVLHPFLMLDDAWWAAVRALLELIAELSRDGAAWVVGGADFAAWLS